MGNFRTFGWRRGLLPAVAAVMLAAALPGAATTADARPAPVEIGQIAASASPTTLAMTPGAPPPQVVAEADREILAGMLLVVFAGMAGVTLVMWRDLARRMKE